MEYSKYPLLEVYPQNHETFGLLEMKLEPTPLPAPAQEGNTLPRGRAYWTRKHNQPLNRRLDQLRRDDKASWRIHGKLKTSIQYNDRVWGLRVLGCPFNTIWLGEYE